MSKGNYSSHCTEKQRHTHTKENTDLNIIRSKAYHTFKLQMTVLNYMNSGQWRIRFGFSLELPFHTCSTQQKTVRHVPTYWKYSLWFRESLVSVGI